MSPTGAARAAQPPPSADGVRGGAAGLRERGPGGHPPGAQPHGLHPPGAGRHDGGGRGGGA